MTGRELNSRSGIFFSWVWILLKIMEFSSEQMYPESSDPNGIFDEINQISGKSGKYLYELCYKYESRPFGTASEVGF